MIRLKVPAATLQNQQSSADRDYEEDEEEEEEGEEEEEDDEDDDEADTEDYAADLAEEVVMADEQVDESSNVEGVMEQPVPVQPIKAAAAQRAMEEGDIGKAFL